MPDSNQPVQTVPGFPPPDTPIISSAPKKKFGGGRIIATILGILVLTGGIIGGVILTQQQQDIRERAAGAVFTCTQAHANQHPQCLGINATWQDSWCEINICPNGDTNGNGACSAGDDTGATVEFGDCFSDILPRVATLTKGTCYQIDTAVSKTDGRWCNLSGDPCIGYQDNLNTCVPQTPPPSPTTPPVTAQCLDVKAYTEAWALVSTAQLSQLKIGNKVNFCVTGSATQGSFDKAKFTINSTTFPETTTARPGSANEFCQLYTIGEPDTTAGAAGADPNSIGVSAQIHHPTLGWIGGKQ